MTRQRWTPEQKAAALEAIREHGLAEAHRQTGIPKPTLCDWARANGVRTFGGEHTVAATEAHKLTAEQRRLIEADAWTTASAAVRQAVFDEQGQLRRDLDPDQAMAVQRLFTAGAIAIDKAQLLAGQATSRTQVVGPDDAQAEIERLQSEWRDRLARKAS